MIFLEFLIVGSVMTGPNLCEIDYVYNDELYSIQYRCDETGKQIPNKIGE